MKISQSMAHGLLATSVLMLVLGTQMPGNLRDAAFAATQLPWQMSKVAHFALFAVIAGLAHASPLNWSLRRVVLGSLALALLTEAFQFAAVGRDPSWRDVCLDCLGAAFGLVLVRNIGLIARAY